MRSFLNSAPTPINTTQAPLASSLTTLDITVAICTYNGADRITQVLDQLAAQTDTANIRWEIIVVDNNSTDDLKQKIAAYQTQQFSPDFLHYVFEAKQGAAFARLAAIQAAKGHLVGFLDDDTVPDANWLAHAYQFGQTHPQAGAYGGQIHGAFAVEPHPEFKPLAIYLAIVERGSQPYIYTVKKRVLPPSAGLIVRRQVWLDHVSTSPQLSGRVGPSLIASEDIEAIAHIQNAGWDIWYNPDMHIYHQIPAWRLERDYLIKLVRGIGLTKHHIRMMRLRPWQRPLAFPIYFANDLRRLASYWLQHRQTITTHLVNACEIQLLIGAVQSPLFLWQLARQRK